jgi:excisionase family DNA binding protein
MAGHRQPANRDDALYDTIRQAARRLTIAVPTLNRLIAAGVIPACRINGRHKIAKRVIGQLVASGYEVWPAERRPHYSAEELRKLSAIRVEQVAVRLGLGRSAAFEAVRNGQVPGRKLPNTAAITRAESLRIGILISRQDWWLTLVKTAVIPSAC